MESRKAFQATRTAFSKPSKWEGMVCVGKVKDGETG